MAGPADAQKRVEEFDRLLKAGDISATKRLVDEYQNVSAQLVRDTEALTKIAQTKGLKPWQVMRMQRYRELQAQYIQNFDRYAEAAGRVISDGQRQAVNLARRGTEATVIAGLPPGVTMDNMASMGLGWNRLPDEAYRNFIGLSSNGQPISLLLKPLGSTASMQIRKTIGTGIALGYGPRKVARQVANTSGMALSRSLLISRTEITRAHREASRLDYQNNSQLVKGYKRVATKADSTCVACIALDGTRYPLNEPLNEHPNGRCSMVPDVLDYADLGLDVERLPEPPTARDWLGNQPEITQRKILGKARFDAWKKGDIQLNQLATVKPNPVWGDSAVVKPLKDLGIAKPPPRPPKPPRLPKHAATRPARPAAPKPPPEVEGDLVDPLTGNKVRGTKATPPEPQLPQGWTGDPDDFLDVSGDIGRGTVKAQINAGVKEQEAWARAAGGAVEVNYQGLSIRAAHQTNKAVEVTIVRNGWRPLDILTTQRVPGRGGAFGRAYAYQHQNGVHINAASASRLTKAPGRLERGSVRAWDKNNLRDNDHVKTRYLEGPERIGKLETELSNKRAIYAEWKKKGDMDAFILDPELIAKGVPPMSPARYQSWIKDYESAIKKAKKQLGKSAAERFHPTTGDEFLKEVVTHEIGHYAHRRWGFTEARSRSVLSSKAGREEARLLSEYAMKNDVEHFAEAFTEHIWLGGARNSPEITSFIEDVIKANTASSGKERIFFGVQ